MTRILAPPERRHRLILRPKLQTPSHTISPLSMPDRMKGNSQFAVHRVPAEDGRLVARPCKRRDGHGNGNVDSDLAGFDVAFKVSRGGAVVGKDGGAVPVWRAKVRRKILKTRRERRTLVAVDQIDGFLQRVNVDPGQNRSKDLDPARPPSALPAGIPPRDDSRMTAHALPRLQQRRPHPVALWVSLDLGAAPVKEDLAAFLFARGNELFNLGLCLRGNHGAATKS